MPLVFHNVFVTYTSTSNTNNANNANKLVIGSHFHLCSKPVFGRGIIVEFLEGGVSENKCVLREIFHELGT